MEIIIGLLILGVVIFVIYNKKTKTTAIIEEVKEEVQKSEETVKAVETAVAVVAKKTANRIKKAAAVEKAVATKVKKLRVKKTKV